MFYSTMQNYLINLPTPHNKQAINNALKAGTVNAPLYGLGQCINPLKSAFRWADTPEGFEYWYEFCNNHCCDYLN